jgi:hypothetical protein
MFRRKQKRQQRDEIEEKGSDLVEVARLGDVEAELISARLRGAEIDSVVFRVGDNQGLSHTEGSRVMVRRRDFEAAQSFLQE